MAAEFQLADGDKATYFMRVRGAFNCGTFDFGIGTGAADADMLVQTRYNEDASVDVNNAGTYDLNVGTLTGSTWGNFWMVVDRTGVTDTWDLYMTTGWTSAEGATAIASGIHFKSADSGALSWIRLLGQGSGAQTETAHYDDIYFSTGENLTMAGPAEPPMLAYFNDGTAADADALTNLASAASVTVMDLSAVGFEAGTLITRNEFGTPVTPAGPTARSAAGSEWLFARSTATRDVPASHLDYFGFTVTADAGKTLDLTNLKFDFVARANAPEAYGTYSAQVFVAVNGGTTFTAIGSSVSSTTTASNVWAPMTSADIDLSTLAGADSVEFRIGLGDGALNSGGGSAWVQGIQLNGTVAPKFAYFNDGTAADADALTNLATVAYVTVSDLSVNRVNDGNITRTEFGGASSTPAGPTAGSAAGSEWLFFRSTVIDASAPVSTQDFFGFTVTADYGKALNLDNLKFDLTTIAGNSGSTNYTATAQVFVAVDGGAFTAIGSSVSSTAAAVGWGTLESVNVDLSTIMNASSVEFRVGLGDNMDNSSAATWVQGLQLNSTALDISVPPLIISAAMNGSGHFSVEVTGLEIGTEYLLMKDADLSMDPSFDEEVDRMTATSRTETLTDTNAVAGQAFYKVTD